MSEFALEILQFIEIYVKEAYKELGLSESVEYNE